MPHTEGQVGQDRPAKVRNTRGGKRHNKAKKRERAAAAVEETTLVHAGDHHPTPTTVSQAMLQARPPVGEEGGQQGTAPAPSPEAETGPVRKKTRRGGKRGPAAALPATGVDGPEAVQSAVPLQGESADSSATTDPATTTTTTTAKSKTRRGGGKKRTRDVADEVLEPELQQYGQTEEGGHAEESEALINPYGWMEEETRSYFKNIESLLDQQATAPGEGEAELVAPDAEDVGLLVANVFKELDGKELLVAADPECSRILEKLLRLASDFHVRVFADRLQGNYADLFQHQFASHVVQTLLLLAPAIIAREQVARAEASDAIGIPSTADAAEVALPPAGVVGEAAPADADTATLPTMLESLLATCEQLEDLWFPLITNPYASHVVRSLLLVLSGEATSAHDVVRSNKSKRYNRSHQNMAKPALAPVAQHPRSAAGTAPGEQIPVPREFAEAMGKITRALVAHLDAASVRSLCFHPVANPVLQQLLATNTTNTSNADGEAMSASATLARLVLGDFGDAEHEAFFRSLLEDRVGSHVVERLLPLLTPAQFMHLYRTYFHTRLADLCNHPVANFVVQKLVAHLQHESQLSIVLVEVGPVLERLLFTSRTGVVVKLLEACIRLRSPTCQAQLMQALLQAYHVVLAPAEVGDTPPTTAANPLPDERRNLARYILTNSTPDTFRTHLTHTLHGSLILQQLLQFEEAHCQVVVESLLSTTPDTLYTWCVDPVMSRILEALLRSPSTLLKAKRKVILTLSGHYASLAKDKYGSHFIDACWAVADVGLKETLVQELARAEGEIAANFHGKFVLRNCRVELYKRRRAEWMQREANAHKRKDMFRDIIGTEAQGEDQRAASQLKDAAAHRWASNAMQEAAAPSSSSAVIEDLFKRKPSSGSKSGAADGAHATTKGGPEPEAKLTKARKEKREKKDKSKHSKGDRKGDPAILIPGAKVDEDLDVVLRALASRT